jgi:hypothetical protein
MLYLHPMRFRAKHALGLDPEADTGSREENASKLNVVDGDIGLECCGCNWRRITSWRTPLHCHAPRRRGIQYSRDFSVMTQAPLEYWIVRSSRTMTALIASAAPQTKTAPGGAALNRNWP